LRALAFLVLWVGSTAVLVALYAAAEYAWETWSRYRGPAMMADEFPHMGGWTDRELARIVAAQDLEDGVES
jgi:hypothetical protein